MLLAGFQTANAQTASADVSISFLKATDSIKPNDMYFNILRIRNNTSKKITGSLAFNGPENWKIITFADDKLQLLPGDSISIPVRVSPGTGSIGGISYLLSASYRANQTLFSASTYIILPSIVSWDFKVNQSLVYITETNLQAALNIHLYNRGNTNEVVRLKMDVGKLLSIPSTNLNSLTDYITLRAYSDTVLSRNVLYQTNLSFADKLRFENNWKESSVKLSASADNKDQSAVVQIQKLSSVYVNQRAQTMSPLNVDYQIYNLMSNQPIRQNARVFGSVLLPQNREIQYVLGAQNVSFSSDDDNSDFDYIRQLIYNVDYTDNHNTIHFGYNVNGGTLHSVNGRGISGMYRMDVRNAFTYAVTQNPYSNLVGEMVGYRTSLKNLSLSTEVVHENNPDGSYQATSALAGIGFNLFRHHTFTVQLLGSKSDYAKTIARDTSVYGMSYRADYGILYDRFNLRFSTVSSMYNKIQNSGIEQSYLDAKYTLSNKWTLNLYGLHMKYALTRFPYNFSNPVNYNGNDNLRLTSSFTAGNVTYQLGPNYTGSTRQFYNSTTGYTSQYNVYQPGVWAALTVKVGAYRSVTPNITVSNMRFYYKSGDPSVANYSFDKNIYYSAGLNYFDNVWRMNMYYTSGSSTDLYRSVLVDSKPTVTRSLQLRPSYENYFFNRKVKFSAYVNYAYYMPSQRENVSYNVRYDQYFKYGWNMSVSGFMFSNTRVDDDQGRITNKDINVMIGITKSFDIQQPRQKYHNFKSVFFNDLDGDKIKSKNEPPVSDILVTVEKDQQHSVGQSNIPEVKLLADKEGTVEIQNLPADNYKLAFLPLNNLQNLYFVNGSEQVYANNKTNTLYVPLSESFKIRGKIILVRDPNSTEGKVDLGGIRITAFGEKGENYMALTDNLGEYVLCVPTANRYKVHINNVFGEQFNIEANEVEVQFTQSKTINADFTFVEKQRGIQFDGGELFNFSSLNGDKKEEDESNNQAQNQDAVQDSTSHYSIQLAHSRKFVDPNVYKKKYKLSGDVSYTEKNGEYVYYTGEYNTKALANKAIKAQKLGVGAVPVLMSTSLVQSLATMPVAERYVPNTPSKNGTKANSKAVKTGGSKMPVNNAVAENEAQNYAGGEGVGVAVDAGSAIQSAAQSTSNSQTAENANTNIRPLAKQPKGKSAKTKATNKSVDVGSAATNNNTANLSSENKPDFIVDGQVVSIPESGKSKTLQSKTVRNTPAVTARQDSRNTTVNENAANQLPDKQGSNNEVTSVTGNDVQKTAVPAVSNKKAERAGLTSVKNSNLPTEPVSNAVGAGPIKVTNQRDTALVKDKGPKILGKLKRKQDTKVVTPGNKNVVAKNEPVPEDKGLMYTIRLDASDMFPNPSYYKEKYRLPFDVICIDKGGERLFFTGKYHSIDEAKSDIARYGITGFIVPMEDAQQ